MDITEERERFLAEQAQRMGEPILCFSLVRVLEGPPLGSELVFFLVGATALHILPVTQEPSVFGISLSRKSVPPPASVSIPREEVGEAEAIRPQNWWEAVAGPRGVIKVAGWKVQSVGDSGPFLEAWKEAWSGPAGS